MLAGTVYFYNENEDLIEEMDLEDYDSMNDEEAIKYIENIKASKVTMTGVTNNHQHKEITRGLPEDMLQLLKKEHKS